MTEISSLTATLTNFAQNGECGAINNVNFGKQNPNARTYAKDLLEGYGNRDFFWDVSAEVQQEIGNNVSMTVGLLSQLEQSLRLTVDRVAHGPFQQPSRRFRRL